MTLIYQENQSLEDKVFPFVRASLERIENPAIAFDHRGNLLAVNSKAYTEIDYEDPYIAAKLLSYFSSNVPENVNIISRLNSCKNERNFDSIATIHTLNFEGLQTEITVIEFEEMFWSLRVSKVLSATYGLTEKEIQVLKQFVAGLEFGQIAQINGTTLGTVRKQFYNAEQPHLTGPY